MPTTKPDSSSVKRGGIDMRVDSAHHLAEPPANSDGADPLPLNQASDVPAVSLAQVQTQADQLAAYLTSRQEELDRQEAELQSGWSALEAASRDARMLVEEREAEVIRREEAVRLREQQLLEREELIARRIAEWASTQSAGEQSAPPQAAGPESPAETMRRSEQLEWDLQRQRALAELARERRILERRGQILDSRRAALEQLRAELTRRHRESLELRLTMEEMWAKLSQEIPAAELAQSLHHTRNQVADHYRLARAELAERQERLEALRSQIAAQHERLAQERQQVIDWADRRLQEQDARAGEIGRRSSRLTERVHSV